MKSRKKERDVQLQEISELRKKNVGEYFLNTSRWHREWLKELARRYKERGEFPMMPMVVLPSYYNSILDKEIALFSALLIKDDAEFEQIREFRNLLGDNPKEWFDKRGFVRLGIGWVQDKRTGGVLNWKIAKLLNRLWDEQLTIKQIAEIERCSYFDVLTYLVEDCGVGDYFYKLRLLLMIAATFDGFGLGLWTVDQSELKCPLTSDVRLFLQTWFPNYRTYGSVDDAIRLFGFERDCDFFYAYLGYKELQKRNPKKCSECATRYLSWYDKGTYRKPHRWREIIPEIDI